MVNIFPWRGHLSAHEHIPCACPIVLRFGMWHVKMWTKLHVCDCCICVARADGANHSKDASFCSDLLTSDVTFLGTCRTSTAYLFYMNPFLLQHCCGEGKCVRKYLWNMTVLHIEMLEVVWESLDKWSFCRASRVEMILRWRGITLIFAF